MKPDMENDQESLWPQDFTVQYKFTSGTVPPPDYYEYVIEIAPDGSGEIHLWWDYPQNHPEIFVELFDADPQAMHNLYLLVASAGLCQQAFFPSPRRPDSLGGSQSQMVFSCGGRSFKVKGALDPDDEQRLAVIYKAIRRLAPVETWEKLGLTPEEID